MLSTHRKLVICDALSLILATAVGLAGLRWVFGDFDQLFFMLRQSALALVTQHDGWLSWAWCLYWVYGPLTAALFPTCLAWTLALLALRFRRPRPRMRRLARLPGATACHSAGLAFVTAPILLGMLFTLGIPWIFNSDTSWWELLFVWSLLLVPPWTGCAVLSSWSTLILCGTWRAEPSWIDRAGRLLGTYWISTILLPLWVYSECLSSGFKIRIITAVPRVTFWFSWV